MKPRIGIVGSGFAGLALAIALTRKGHRPSIIEKRSEQQLLGEGLFVTLAPNGMNALRGLGLAEKALAQGVETKGLVLHNEHGRVLGDLDYRRHAQAFAAPSVTIRRGALGGILLEAARAEAVDIRFGAAVQAVTETDAEVRVTTDDGVDTAFDILVAADGLRSTVRQRVMPDLPAPVFNGLQGSGGIADIPDIPATNGRMLMTFGRDAFLGYIKEENGPVYWFNTYRAGADSRPARDEDLANLLADLHRTDPEINRRIIAAADPASLRVYPDYDMPGLPRWSTARTVLVGDAAHAVTPHSGQGASMALEDALVLAACIEAEASPTGAFQRFETLRRDRVAAAVRLGRQGGAPKKAQGWLALRLRDLFLPLFVPIGQKAQERLFAYRADLNPLIRPD